MPGCIGREPAAESGMRSGRIITRLDIYIFRQVLLALVVATCGLTALIWLTQSLRFVVLVVNRGLSFLVFLHLTSLLIPSFIAVIMPITCFVVVQFVYQRLAGDRELTVMRGAGLSPFGLARPALAVALIATGAGYWLNLWGVPATLSDFRDFQWEIRNRMAAFLLQEGVFTPISDKLTVYIRSRDPDGTLRGILVDDGREASAQATILAEHGRLLEGDNGPRVLLINGSREEIDRQTGRLNVLTFAENAIDLSPTARGEEQRFRDMSEMSIAELLHPPAGFPDRDIMKLRVEAHRRMATPLTALTFTLVALVAVLMGTFRRHGGLLRPFIAVLTVVALLALELMVGNLAAKRLSLVALIWANALLPALLCAWALFGPQLRLMPVTMQVKLGVS